MGRVIQFAAARPNRLFDADAKVLRCAPCTRLPVAGQLRR